MKRVLRTVFCGITYRDACKRQPKPGNSADLEFRAIRSPPDRFELPLQRLPLRMLLGGWVDDARSLCLFVCCVCVCVLCVCLCVELGIFHSTHNMDGSYAYGEAWGHNTYLYGDLAGEGVGDKSLDAFPIFWKRPAPIHKREKAYSGWSPKYHQRKDGDERARRQRAHLYWAQTLYAVTGYV